MIYLFITQSRLEVESENIHSTPKANKKRRDERKTFSEGKRDSSELELLNSDNSFISFLFHLCSLSKWFKDKGDLEEQKRETMEQNRLDQLWRHIWLMITLTRTLFFFIKVNVSVMFDILTDHYIHVDDISDKIAYLLQTYVKPKWVPCEVLRSSYSKLQLNKEKFPRLFICSSNRGFDLRLVQKLNLFVWVCECGR